MAERDLCALADIERSAAQAFLRFPELAWLADGDVLSMARHRQFMELGTTWVAVDEHDQPLGFISAEPIADMLHVWEASVRRGCQGQGLGKALMRRAIQEAEKRKLSGLTLTTFKDVPWNAPFYERCGFRCLGDAELDERLACVLRDEALHGMPRERRCAMAAYLPLDLTSILPATSP